MDRLKAITSLLADKALSPVALAGARVRAIETQVEGIAAHRKDLMRASVDPSVAGSMLAQAERLRKQQAAAMSQLAGARVAFEKEKVAAAKAVGRDLVLGKLIEKQKAAAKQEQDRRKLR
ncbi:hypothetical protein [Gymnodinialimonas ulvae]|uniref:hypothetical protein n=1 Tax=Gymnodinialimonas ulvae TaxID=3126504 RepID=UPI0030B2F03F